MKKILFLIHDLGYGGAEKVLVNLANHLDKTKYDVTVQTLFDVGENKQFLSKDVKYIGGWKKVFRGNAALMRLLPVKWLSQLVIKCDYDVVVSFLEGPCTRIVSACQGRKIAWVHTAFKRIESLTSHYKSLNEMQNCYNQFDLIVCVSETVKDNFLSYLVPSAPCRVLHNVNDTAFIIAKSKEYQNVIVRNDSCINMVSVGRLIIPYKGYDRLIRIHKKLLDNGINNKLYILGDGPDKDKLQNLITQLHVSDTCKLLGFDENPYKYVVNADLFVCSSHKEGFSTAVTEALILGVAVVSTEVSGAKELLGDNNEYGIVTENTDEELYNGIYNILKNQERLDYYKNQSAIRGKAFHTEQTVKEAERVFESL